MTTHQEVSETNEQFLLQLNDYLSPCQFDNQEMHFLNLDRCLRQPYTLNDISNNEIIGGISLAHNYLIQIPSFVADYTNLIELNASGNELHETEFLLYRSLDQSESRPLIHPFLQKINLSFNHIKSLPSNLDYLRFLHTLDFSYNYLEELPDTIGSLEHLTTLILNDNHLKTLPNTFTRLTQLEYCDLSSNQLQSIDIMKNFVHLKSFAIDSNPLKTFPILLHTCFNLEEISLSNIQLQRMNELTFDYFQQFSRLKKLNLSKNHLTNRFFASSIQPFDCLEELYLDHNQLTNIFSLLSTMKSLYILDLSFNSLSNLPKCVHSQLKILRLSNNQIEIDAQDCIDLKYLSELDLDHNQIQDIPYEFIQCVNLQSFNLSSNPIKQFPEVLLQLRSLNKLLFNASELLNLPSYDFFRKYFSRTLNILDFSQNNLHSNLYELTTLKALRYLDLSDNQMTELHQDFRLMTCLQVLKLNRNKFTKVPDWLYQMSNERNQKYIGATLLELYLGDNQLKSIPEEIIHMTSLQTIDLSNNPLPIFPESLAYLEELSTLIYSQEHGGYIEKLPDDFLQLHNLKMLDLSHNTFYEIPQMIYALPQLKYLNMSFNLLTGLETNRLKQMKNLEELQLNGNQFPFFPSILYQFDTVQINENIQCSAPPNDFLKGKYLSAISNLFVQIHDQFEEKLFQIYKQIFVENLTNADIERLLIRLKLSEKDMNYFRKNYHHVRREEKIEILFHLWKQKRDSLANSDTLYKLTQLIGDKKLIQQMKKAYLLARRVRV